MKPQKPEQEKRNLAVLFGQRALATIGWTMASPAVVLPYLVISLEMPVFLAGFLVSLRRSANLGTAVLGAEFAAARTNKKADISATDFVLAMCYVLALASIAINSSFVVTALLVLAVLIIGLTEEFQNLISWDFLADTLQSDNRQRLTYSAMAIGGLGAILLTWIAHIAMKEHPPLTRHSTVIVIAVVCFLVSAASILLVRELKRSAANTNIPAVRNGRLKAARQAIAHFYASLRNLLSMPWFRKYVMMRIALQTVELSVPFFAILAAISHGASQKGLTALVISSAAALVVAGPVWRAVGRISNAAVMAGGALVAALAGVLLVGNYYVHLADITVAHSITLFAVTVGMQGVSSARALYYMDMAPKEYRVSGLAVSKSVVRVFGVVLAAGMAALAHLQHVTWAISLVAILNICTAIFVFSAASQPAPDSKPT
ncbi:MAG: permease [Hyphomicrobiales bacterium]|nr:permease [Hyphomicrobiales bacterium]MCP4999687.1 permease [Hyphomicrobiales bacterium]